MPTVRRRALSDEALAIAHASGDEATIVRVLNWVSLSLLAVASLLQQSLSRSADALARAERIGDPVLPFEAAALRNVIAIQAGDLVEVDRSMRLPDLWPVALNQPTHRHGVLNEPLVPWLPVTPTAWTAGHRSAQDRNSQRPARRRLLFGVCAAPSK